MKIHTWEDEKLFTIEKELKEMIKTGIVKGVISMNLVYAEQSEYSAILIYK
jgi:hypothetical protein